MHHGAELTVVLLVCLVLAAGALTRLGRRWLRLPYTVLLLLIGCGAGLLLSQAGEHEITRRLAAGSRLSPDLIIFVFLPALVFESAFALDVHAFRKELPGVSILAVPALLASTAAVGGFMYFLSGLSWSWSLSAALVFGALISATDPVAVVAILRGTTSPKRLAILVEGESLLNDGTAIVIFGTLLALLVEPGADLALGTRALDFTRVVGGGVVVGLVLAIAATAIIARVFNDPMVEITLTIVTAYAAMLVAEFFFHVSGVMAVVTSGLWMAGPGRTRISPEVQHFLHHFWEMVSYLANTLIFFLVGLVIAAQWQNASLVDLAVIVAAYVGIMMVRFLVVFLFRPIVGLVAAPLRSADATILSWGGLRGAVSLALALIVSQRPEVDPALRHQILLVTTGVVLLTILVNGSTVSWLLGRLGLDRRPAAERVAELTVQATLLNDVRAQLGKSSRNRDLALVPWRDVQRDVESRVEDVQKELEAARSSLDQGDPVAGYWQHALSIERRAYWTLHAQGTLSGRAASILDREVALQLDRIARADTAPPQSRIRDRSLWHQRLLTRVGLLAEVEFGRLSLSYDLARAQSVAAEEVLDHLSAMDSDRLLEPVLATYESYHRSGKERVEEIRSALPEVAQAIESRLAQRISLNIERSEYEEFLERGAMDPRAADAALVQIQARMKRLLRSPRRVPIPETALLVRDLPLFQGLSRADLDELADITRERIFEPGAELMREGETGSSMFVIARGAVHVLKTQSGREELLDTVGTGEIVGEMALMTDEPRHATVRAATTVTAGQVDRRDFERVMEAHEGIHAGILRTFAMHRFDNVCRRHRRFSQMDRDRRMSWFNASPRIEEWETDSLIEPDGAAFFFVASGSLDVSGFSRSAPILLAVQPGEVYRVTEPAILVRLAAPPEGEPAPPS